MNLFQVIDGSAVVMRSRGIYRQAQAFYRGDEVFARHGNGFIKLGINGATSLSTVSWLHIEAPGVSVAEGKRPRYAAPRNTARAA